MTDEELRDTLASLRRVGSDLAHVEAKAARGGLPKDLWRTLSAFANTPGGGVIILGVDENRGFEPVGVQDPAALQADIASLCDRMVPPLRPLIEVHTLENRQLLTVEVQELPYEQKPCFYAPAGLINGAYIRVADGDRRLSSYEVHALLEKRHQPRHDIEPVEDAHLEELDKDLLERFLRRIRDRRGRRWQEMSDMDALRTLRVIADVDGRAVPTLAGYLCFGNYPQERFPDLCVTFVRYPTDRAGEPGPSGERFLDNEKVTGPIPEMVMETLRVLKRNMRRREIVRGLFREDVWEYPEDVLREAIVNALGHRDYSPAARGSHVQVQMFPTRLTIINPGGLFGPVTIDDLGRPGVQASRNQYLMNILEELPAGPNGATLCEHRGSGIAAMIATLRRLGMQPPVFEDRVVTFEVGFSNASLLDEDSLRWLEARSGYRPLSDPQRLALAYLRHRSYIGNQDYCRLTGVDSRVATRELSELVEQGLVVRHGVRRWATYSLAGEQESVGAARAVRIDREPPAVAPAGAPTTGESVGERVPIAQRVRHALQRSGDLSVRELTQLTGASPSSVRLVLNHLLKEGLVEAIGALKSPRRRYRWAAGGSRGQEPSASRQPGVP